MEALAVICYPRLAVWSRGTRPTLLDHFIG
jgi:hypothetical protein